jgi:hypothetical protein
MLGPIDGLGDEHDADLAALKGQVCGHDVQHLSVGHNSRSFRLKASPEADRNQYKAMASTTMAGPLM